MLQGFILDDHIGNRGRKVYVVSFDRGKLWDESIDGVFKVMRLGGRVASSGWPRLVLGCFL